MATQQAITDYTNRDYSSLLGSLLDLAVQKLPEWTDRSENDFGRMMMELFAYVGDILFYYQDRIANEAFLSTAVERRSVIDLLSLIGYTLSTPAPATADLTLTAPNDDAADVRVEVGARFATEAAPNKPAVEFVYLPVTNTSLEVARNGSGGQISFGLSVVNAVPIDDEVVGTSNGEANQGFKLSQWPVLLPRDADSQDNFTIEVDPGGGYQVWGKRGTLLYSRSDDLHFTVHVDESDIVEVIFGDSVFGQIPPAGSSIRVSYLTGGGSSGNVGANTIITMKSGVNVSVEVTNTNAASGGTDRETIANARFQAPQVFRSMDRAVTGADIAALARNIPSVARAVAVAPSWNYVDLYIVAFGGMDLTDELRASVLRYFKDRSMVTTLISVRQPVFVSIDLTLEVGINPTFYRDDVQQRLKTAVNALFDIGRLDFGRSFYLSKVFEAAEAVAGVDFARVTVFRGIRSQPVGQLVDPAAAATGLIQLQAREFPRQGTLIINVIGGLG